MAPIEILNVDQHGSMIRIWIKVGNTTFVRIANRSYGTVAVNWRYEAGEPIRQGLLEKNENEEMESVFRAHCLAQNIDIDNIKLLTL